MIVGVRIGRGVLLLRPRRGRGGGSEVVGGCGSLRRGLARLGGLGDSAFMVLIGVIGL